MNWLYCQALRLFILKYSYVVQNAQFLTENLRYFIVKCSIGITAFITIIYRNFLSLNPFQILINSLELLLFFYNKMSHLTLANVMILYVRVLPSYYFLLRVY